MGHQVDDPDPAAPVVVTEDDVAGFNRDTVVRSANLARTLGSCILGAATVAVVAWGWFSVRNQQLVSERGGDFGTVSGDIPGTRLLDRIDVFASSMSTLVLAAIAVGVGVGLRLLADYTAARVGGTLTGFEPGDVLPDDEEADE